MAIKLTKEQKQRKTIADTLVQIRNARENFQELAEKYDEWIDDAADLREDAYSDQLIEDKVGVLEMVRNFKFIETQIETGAITSAAFGELNNLPEAITACRTILNKKPNIQSLSKELSKLQSSLKESREALRSMRRKLTDDSSETYKSIFGEKKSMSPEFARQVEEEKRARQARLGARIAKKEAPVVVDSVQGETMHDIDSILRAIDEEKKKH